MGELGSDDLLSSGASVAAEHPGGGQETQGQNEGLKFLELDVSAEFGGVQLDKGQNEVDQTNESSEDGVDQESGAGEADLGPGEDLSNKLAAFFEVDAAEALGQFKAGVFEECLFEGCVALVEGGVEAVDVLEGVPSVEGEEGEEGGSEDEGQDFHHIYKLWKRGRYLSARTN